MRQQNEDRLCTFFGYTEEKNPNNSGLHSWESPVNLSQILWREEGVVSLFIQARILLCCFFLMLVGYTMPIFAAPPPDPVIFIPGLGADTTSWIDLVLFLEKQGWKLGGLPILNSKTGKIDPLTQGDFYVMAFSDNQNLAFDEQAKELNAVINAVLVANPTKARVILVGHSMGGLAARYYLQFDFHDDNISGLITIGTPHQGAEAAVIVQEACQEVVKSLICDLFSMGLHIDPFSKAMTQLRPASAVLNSLNDLVHHPLPSQIQYTSIIGKGTPVIGSPGWPFTGTDGDGVVSVDSQNLANIAGASQLHHTVISILIADRTGCDPGFTPDPIFGIDTNIWPNETHTCETSDSGVGTELLRQLDFHSCSLYSAGSTIPAGWGVPWDVFNPSTLVLKASCSALATSTQMGPATYVYHQGYAWDGSQWHLTDYQCTGGAKVSSTWCPNTAEATLPNTAIYYAAFTCNFVNNTWKCGCRDQVCTTQTWQLQQIQR